MIIQTVDILTVVVAALGGVFAFFQWWRSSYIKRAEYINELTEKIRSDNDIREIVYLIEYGNEDWYTEKFHGSPELEKNVDKTLSYFSYICYLKSMRIISARELSFFEYKITRILKDDNIQRYLFNLHHFSEKNDVPMSFNYLLKYGKSHKLLSKEFYKKDSKEYQEYKYLNF